MLVGRREHCLLRERRPTIGYQKCASPSFQPMAYDDCRYCKWDRYLLRERRPAIGYQTVRIPLFNQLPAMIVGRWEHCLLKERRPAIGYQNSAYPSFQLIAFV
jgi:hypothetical protein